MATRMLSFTISEKLFEQLALFSPQHGQRSSIVKSAALEYASVKAAKYHANVPKGPYTKKINVVKGDWFEHLRGNADRLGITVSALARYSLSLMLEAMQEEREAV
jgi:hypothetical protein